MRRIVWPIFGVLLAVLACGGSDPGFRADVPGPHGDVTDPGAPALDIAVPLDETDPRDAADPARDGGADKDDADHAPDPGHGPDDVPTDGPDDVPADTPTDPGDPCAPPAGEGCPCAVATDCLGALCVETEEGGRCSFACADGDAACLADGAARCTGDLALLKVAGPDGPRWECRPVHPRLCRPCRARADCASDVPSACVAAGDEGSFCATRCNDAVDCPAGYACEPLAAPVEGVEAVCRRTGGPCPCSPAAAATAASTECRRTTPAGTCSGVRACTADGLAPCSAPVAVEEACNGLDDDCDGRTDEDFPDRDGDGLADCVDPVGDQDGDGDPDDLDCAPQDPAVHHGAKDLCNGVDDDCDGRTDVGGPGCSWWFADGDGDGFGAMEDGRCQCGPSPGLSARNNGDCNDGDAAVHPGAPEVCDGRDNDCNGLTDEGAAACTTFLQDADGDGYGVDGTGRCLCAPEAPFTASRGGDCDDARAGTHPGAPEACDGLDDDCDGSTDPDGAAGCLGRWLDADGDGFGNGGAQRCLCAPGGGYTATNGDDCNDSNPAVRPGAPEVCNGVDDNCDGATDPAGVCVVVPRRRLCLDPGHGGSDPGAVQFVVEKDVNLDVGLRLRALLNADEGNGAGGGSWSVLMTRDGDTAISLQSRTDYANASGVDRFLSIHNNACGSCGGTGTETYWYSYGDANDQAIAAAVQGQVVAHLGLRNRGVKQANFHVLRETTMPAELNEGGFVDTQADAARLGDPGWRQEIARGMLHGAQNAFGLAEFDP